jgi:hypothetical protein
MRQVFWLTLLVVSCTSNYSSSSKERYEVMHELWQKKANRSEVISALGTSYQTAPGGVTYSFPTFNYPMSGHFFSQDNRLITQFVYLEEREFEIFKDKIKCPWIVERKMIPAGHTVKTIEYGTCKSLNVKYTYPSNLNTYEIRWEKQHGGTR